MDVSGNVRGGGGGLCVPDKDSFALYFIGNVGDGEFVGERHSVTARGDKTVQNWSGLEDGADGDAAGKGGRGEIGGAASIGRTHDPTSSNHADPTGSRHPRRHLSFTSSKLAYIHFSALEEYLLDLLLGKWEGHRLWTGEGVNLQIVKDLTVLRMHSPSLRYCQRCPSGSGKNKLGESSFKRKTFCFGTTSHSQQTARLI